MPSPQPVEDGAGERRSLRRFTRNSGRVGSADLMMIKLYSPENEIELALIRSILDAEDIGYYVKNDHFGSLKVGPKIELFNAKTILVSREDHQRAKYIMSDFIQLGRKQLPSEAAGYDWRDKIRMLLEIVLFAWIMPGRYWRRKAGPDQKTASIDSAP